MPCALASLALLAGLSAAAPAGAAPFNLGAQVKPSVAPEPERFDFGIFGSLQLRTPKHRFQENWKSVLERVEQERALYSLCEGASPHCPAKLTAWRRIVKSMHGLPPLEQLRRVNKAINGLVKYADDVKVFGKRDYWASPVEFVSGRGDCEDYAILKFLTLLELGFDNDQLRVAVVKDRRRRVLHAVLTVNLHGRVYVLDSLYGAVVEHQYVLKYVPIFSANLSHQWVHVVTRQIRAKFVTAIEERRLKPKRTSGVKSAPPRSRKRAAALKSARSRSAVVQTSDAPNSSVSFVDWT
ncbi:MAG: transglutaminase-like cysteine peptidase [Methyloligellaceae bacterium]